MPNKVLLFFVFDPLRDIVADALAQNEVRFVNPKGGGSRIDRAVKEFRDCPDPCALLLAVKNAGQGLTLTEANKVVVVEPIDDSAQLAQVCTCTKNFFSWSLYTHGPCIFTSLICVNLIKVLSWSLYTHGPCIFTFSYLC